MTDKELRKLRRDDLLQILISQQKQIDELTAALEQSERALEDRRIAIRESGSIAEAALKLTGIFDKAQEAADQYLEEVRLKRESAEDEARKSAEAIVREAERRAGEIIRVARIERERIGQK